LLQAAWQGDIRIVRRLLSPGNKGVLDINHKNADGFTPLLLVTRDLQLFQKLELSLLKNYKPADVVTHLIKHQADMNASDELGRTALHYAATSGGTFGQHIVALLLDEGTEIDHRDHHCNAPIHFASETGNVDMIEFLIGKGANVNALGRDGSTPLHFSAEGGHEEASDSLLDHGADITLANERGLTPVDVAKGQKLKLKLREAWTESTTKLCTGDNSVDEESASTDQQELQDQRTVLSDGELPKDVVSDGELPRITPDSLSSSDNESSFFVTQKNGSPKSKKGCWLGLCGL
jgi:ankyrin repeat protein